MQRCLRSCVRLVGPMGLALLLTTGCGARQNTSALKGLQTEVQTLQAQLARSVRRVEQLSNRMLVMSHRLESSESAAKDGEATRRDALEVVRLVPEKPDPAPSTSRSPYEADEPAEGDDQPPPIQLHITGDQVTKYTGSKLLPRLPKKVPPKSEAPPTSKSKPKASSTARGVSRVRTFKVRRGHTTSSAQSIADFRRALDAYRAGFPQKAEKLFAEFVSTYPTDEQAPHARYWLGVCQFELANYGGATKSLQEFATRHPASDKLPDALLKAGVAYERLGDRKRSRGLFRRIVKKYPHSAMADLARARLDEDGRDS